MKKEIVVFGIGDFARLVHHYLSVDSPYKVVAFTVNQRYLPSPQKFRGLDVIPFENLEAVYPPDQYSMFVAVGYKRVNKSRAEIYQACKQIGYELISYINSKSTHWGEIEIGDNCFVFENNVIHPFAKVGNDVIIWSGNYIGHDTNIGDHCFISAHAVISGHVSIGPYCFIGVNATIRDGISVGRECVIGAGVLIKKNTQPCQVYSGPLTEPLDVLSSELKSFQ